VVHRHNLRDRWTSDWPLWRVHVPLHCRLPRRYLLHWPRLWPRSCLRMDGLHWWQHCSSMRGSRSRNHRRLRRQKKHQVDAWPPRSHRRFLLRLSHFRSHLKHVWWLECRLGILGDLLHYGHRRLHRCYLHWPASSDDLHLARRLLPLHAFVDPLLPRKLPQRVLARSLRGRGRPRNDRNFLGIHRHLCRILRLHTHLPVQVLQA